MPVHPGAGTFSISPLACLVEIGAMFVMDYGVDLDVDVR